MKKSIEYKIRIEIDVSRLETFHRKSEITHSVCNKIIFSYRRLSDLIVCISVTPGPILE